MPLLLASSSRLAGASATSASTTASLGLDGRLLFDVGLDPERAEHIRDARHRRRTETQQVVRAARQRRGDLARHCEHLSPLVEREIGGDQRTAALTCLDDDRHVGEPRDDAVARRETPGRRLDARRVLRDDEALLGDLLREFCVSARIVAVDPAAETAIVSPASSAPRWAAASIPRARPETTTTPAAASSRAIPCATEVPYPEHARAPTTARDGSRRARRAASPARRGPAAGRGCCSAAVGTRIVP